MKGIKKILVPLDDSQTSQRGLDEAIYLARQCGAKLTGLSVLDHLPVSGIHNVSSWRKNWIKQAKSRLAKAKRHAKHSGVDLNEKIAYGYAGNEIADHARKNKFDLIVIGSRGKGSVKETFLGSTSHHVVHKSKVPVVVVK